MQYFLMAIFFALNLSAQYQYNYTQHASWGVEGWAFFVREKIEKDIVPDEDESMRYKNTQTVFNSLYWIPAGLTTYASAISLFARVNKVDTEDAWVGIAWSSGLVTGFISLMHLDLAIRTGSQLFTSEPQNPIEG